MKRAFGIILISAMWFAVALPQDANRGRDAAGADAANRAAAFVRRGEALLRERKYEAALLEFQAARRIDERLAVAHLGSALAYEGLQNVAGTVNSLKHVVELDPRNLDARAKLGNYYLALGAKEKNPKLFAEAETLARDIIARDRRHVEGYTLLATILFVRGDRAASLKQLEQAVALAPNRIETHLGIARFHVATNDAARAEEIYRRVIADNPNAPLAHIEYGRFLATLNRMDEAGAAFRRAVEVAPGDAGARAVLDAFNNRDKTQKSPPTAPARPRPSP